MKSNTKSRIQVQHRTLIDFGADVNYTRNGLIPSRYFEKSIYKIHTAGGRELRINYKISKIQVCAENTCIKISFLPVKKLR